MDDENSFETCSVEFQMRGRSGGEQVFNTSRRNGVTPPEFRILEVIHGKDCVKITALTDPASELDIDPDTGKQSGRIRTHDEELDRLRNWYGTAFVAKAFDGQNPQLPYTFKEARIPTKIPDNVAKLAGSGTAEQQRKRLGAAVNGGQGQS